uniref:TNFR-Cys domain-containing protein n=1 Tax=Globisporangium ultimum (strain ATCC 200006 / CBS 805.95 / DAOM BR144) TaxID=431595 RepID=K3WBB0_GLOUD
MSNVGSCCFLFALALIIHPSRFTPQYAHALTPGRFQFAQPVYVTTEDFGVAYVTVQRGLGVDGRAAVYVSTLHGGGNATIGRDFKAVYNRSLVWQDGDDLEKELYIKILNDGRPQELAKTFTLFLHDANGANINSERNTTQVILAPPTNLFPGSFRFLNKTFDASESKNPLMSPFVAPVIWENGTTATARVAFEISCDSGACSTDDFTVLSPTDSVLKWTRGGPSVQNITIAIPDDDIYEQVESFRIRLRVIELPPGDEGYQGAGATGSIGSIGEIVVRISGPNDVHTGSVQFAAECFPDCPSTKYRVLDGGVAQVILQRRNGSDSAVSVSLRALDDTAIAHVDYKPLSQIIRWEDGDSQDKVVLVEALAGVFRLENKRFSLVLAASDGAAVSGAHASTSYVEIVGPSNVLIGDVNFATTEALDNVLWTYPDRSILPFATRLNSHLSQCPRLVVRKPGTITLLLQRDFASTFGPASVTLQTIEVTALAGLDFDPLSTDTVISWGQEDTEIKSLSLTIRDPHEYYVGQRTFWVQIASVTNVGLGNCHLLEVVLDSVGQVPHVISFVLDMNLSKLTLSLSHRVLAKTLDASKIQLQSKQNVLGLPTSSPQALSLSRDTTTSSADGTLIVLDISEKELNALKAMPEIATSANTVFLSVRPGLFDYVADDCIGSLFTACAHGVFDAISPSDALPVTNFVKDTIAPTLRSFSLDVSQRLLKLRFSEPVDPASVRIEAIILADTAIATNMYQLSPSTTHIFRPQPEPWSGALLQDSNRLPADGTYLTLQLGVSDIDALKNVGNGQVGQQRASTFLAMTSDFVSDFDVPPNAVQPIDVTAMRQVAAADCSPCPANTFMTSSCSDVRDRVCSVCTVCPTNSFALTACTPLQDTTCYPCTECRGGQFASVQCTPTTDRVCSTCTKCTRDEYEASPCFNGVDRVCRTCDSCTLTKEQQRICEVSFKWRRKVMKAPYACPLASQTYQTLEARLQRAKSNRCGAGRCSCSNSGVGNFNPNADSFPDDPRCTEPAVYNIFL